MKSALIFLISSTFVVSLMVGIKSSTQPSDGEISMTDLSLAISLEKTIFHLDDEIWVSISMVNSSNKIIIINKRMSVNSNSTPEPLKEISFTILSEQGNPLPFTSRITPRMIRSDDFFLLLPGLSYEKNRRIENLYNLGINNYSIYATYKNVLDPKIGIAWKGKLHSNIVNFNIIP